ncbi:MAG: hypothetical protein ACXW32_11690 [Limisphaerales bacterium]
MFRFLAGEKWKMSNTTKGFFIFLLAFSLVSVGILFDGVGRMKRNGAPPFNEGLVTSVDSLPRPPEELLLRLDQRPWRIAVWIVAMVVPIVCGILAFRSERSVTAFAMLVMWATLAGFAGIWVWLYSAFHRFKG